MKKIRRPHLQDTNDDKTDRKITKYLDRKVSTKVPTSFGVPAIAHQVKDPALPQLGVAEKQTKKAQDDSTGTLMNIL